jgi:hypothetical protein
MKMLLVCSLHIVVFIVVLILPVTRIPFVDSFATPSLFSSRPCLQAARIVVGHNNQPPITYHHSSALLSRQKTGKAPKEDGDTNKEKSLFGFRWIRRTNRRTHARVTTTTIVATILTTTMTALSRPAAAKFGYEIQEQPTHSIRPGMSRQQADLLEEGLLDLDQVLPGGDSASAPLEIKPQQTQRTTATTASYGYGEEEDDDDDDDDELIVSRGRPSDQAAAARLQARTSRSFATTAETATTKDRKKSLTIKVALCFFVPTYGTLILREYVRRRREQNYVKKGLEIMQAQKAEYFNVTSTSKSASDADVQDAIKGIKNNKNETKSEDDDGDDDEPLPPSRGSPRRGPPPPQPRDGGGGKSGTKGPKDSGDPGYGKPSDDDVDKLKRMFGR